MPRRQADKQHVTQQAGPDGTAVSANQSHSHRRRQAPPRPNRSPAQGQVRDAPALHGLAGDEDPVFDEEEVNDDELLVLEGGTVTIEGGMVRTAGGLVTIEGGLVTMTGRSVEEDARDATDHRGDDEEDSARETPIVAEHPREMGSRTAARASPGSHSHRRKKR